MKQSKGLSIAVTALTVLLCAALCLSVLALYHTGMTHRAETSAAEPVFTRGAVGRQLLRVAPLALLWLASVIASVFSGWASARRAPAAAQTPETALRLLEARIPELPESARSERKKRQRNRVFCGAVLVLCAVWALVWLLNGSHFQSWDLESVMGAMLLHILPPAVLGFAALFLFAKVNDDSRIREIGILRELLRQPPAEPVRSIPVSAVSETRGRRILRAALYAAAVLLVILGILNGGLNDVFVKAVNICTECIGLG